MFTESQKDQLLFPFSTMRGTQKEMISDISRALEEKRSIITHAPTGIGKTASALAPALTFAIKNNLSIFFLTSRQTQHRIVIDTLKEIKKKFDIEIECADIIGKKSMCLQGEVDSLNGASFHEFCKSLREENKCEYYSNTRTSNNQPSVAAKHAADQLRMIGPCHVQEFINKGETNKLCPYELAMITAANAKVIVADYYYLFSKPIRDGFLLKTKKELEKSIIIIDEAHNLPTRIRELLSQNMSSQTIEYAKKEAEKFKLDETLAHLEIVENALFEISKEVNEEAIVSRIEFYDAINTKKTYDEVMTELMFSGDSVRDLQKRSFILSVAKFMESWLGSDIGYGRILKKTNDKKLKIDLSYRCLDPSLAAKDVIEKNYSTVLMSGTLMPTNMYKDLLGFGANTIEKEYKNPFPKKNRLNLIIPKTTTKFSERNHKQFVEIAAVCNKISETVPGNLAFFFPSYELMLNIYARMKDSNKPIFTEKQGMQKNEKEQMINSFKSYKDKGALLFGISTGSFGEGIDMPDILKAVVIVGLPLQKPDMEVKLLIEYYDDKYSKGMEYGYIMPAITKCLQNAGRCIRSETDKGAIIFLDERYASQSYHQCFPDDWEFEIESEFEEVLGKFFCKVV